MAIVAVAAGRESIGFTVTFNVAGVDARGRADTESSAARKRRTVVGNGNPRTLGSAIRNVALALAISRVEMR